MPGEGEGWALFFILAVIVALVVVLVKLLKKDLKEDEAPPISYDYSSAPTPTTPVSTPPKTPVKSAKAADEQSYYQFTGPSLRQCAFCGGENELGATRCQVCGKSL